MKSTVVDESLSTTTSRVLFQRKNYLYTLRSSKSFQSIHQIQIENFATQMLTFPRPVNIHGSYFHVERWQASIHTHERKCDAVIKLKALKSEKYCGEFNGMVRFLSSFLKKSKKKCHTILWITEKTQKKSFIALKNVKKHLNISNSYWPPHQYYECWLQMISSDWRVIQTKQQEEELCFDSNKVKWVQTGYHSKKWTQAVQDYGITEIEWTHLVCNRHSFNQLSKYIYFEVFGKQKRDRRPIRRKERTNTDSFLIEIMGHLT